MVVPVIHHQIHHHILWPVYPITFLSIAVPYSCLLQTCRNLKSRDVYDIDYFLSL